MSVIYTANPGPVSAFDGDYAHLFAQQTQSTVEESEAEVIDEDEYEDEDEYDDEYEDEDEYESVQLINDPFERLNRDMWDINYGVYVVFLRPAARLTKTVVPWEIRTGIRNFMYNIRFPVRFINCLLQAKFDKAGREFGDFFVNTTYGFLGLADPAATIPGLSPSEEDLGQTFAVWGIGQGPFIMAPFFGPLTTRHVFGKVGDTFFDPIWWLFDDIWVSVAIRAGETINSTTFRLGDLEAIMEASLDPYVAIRNGYVQSRNALIAE